MANNYLDFDENDPVFLAKNTPTMRQFLIIKKKHPHLLLLYRIGDFYETFYDDAERIHRLLGLTLTSRSANGDGDRIPMAGVPFMTLDQYLVRLVNQGVSVGICEQIGVPGKGPMERRLTRIITPGTLTDENLLGERSESILMAINPSKKGEKVALSWLILSSGLFKVMEVSGADLINEIARISPSELLVPERFRDEANRIIASGSVNVLPDWHFDRIRSEKTLLEQFKTGTLEAFGLEGQDLMITAAGTIIEYALQTQGTELSHINHIIIEKNEETLGLDAATRKNLEITQSLRGDQRNTLVGVLDHCRTAMGSRRLSSWLNSPLRNSTEAIKRADTIETLLEKTYQFEELQNILKGVPDFERIATRIALDRVRPKDLASLRDALPSLKLLSDHFESLDTELSRELSTEMPLDPELHRLLTAAIVNNPPAFLRDGDVIAIGYNAELDEYRALRDNSGEFILAYEQKEKERTGINNLRIEYNGKVGYYIEITKSNLTRVPEDYLKVQTLKNAERYTTPELRQYQEKHIIADEKSKSLQQDLYQELVEKIKPFTEHLLSSAKAVSIFDTLLSLALHADLCRWVKPRFTQYPELQITGGRHPVVEKSIDNYVPNDCLLNPQRKLMVITGPNMGGKSTYMRSVALITLLAYCGSYVPAEEAVLGPVDKILTRIGASDDLAKGLSTFMVEMTETASILRQATAQSLVLMDEVGRGTSTFDGLSLAGAIAEDLALNRQSMTLFATHYFELTQLEKRIPGVFNVHVSATETANRLVFLHEIQEGPASKSYGISVAKLAGVPKSVIKSAQRLQRQLEENAAKNSEPQLDLFFDTPLGDTLSVTEDEPQKEEKDELKDALLEIDMDELSPRQAWEMLSSLQKQAKESE